MALNIKNEHTVALVRELATLTDATMTSAIEEAVMARLESIRTDGPTAAREKSERLASIRALTDEFDASLTDQERERLATTQREMYDAAGLPR